MCGCSFISSVHFTTKFTGCKLLKFNLSPPLSMWFWWVRYNGDCNLAAFKVKWREREALWPRNFKRVHIPGNAHILTCQSDPYRVWVLLMFLSRLFEMKSGSEEILTVATSSCK